MRWFQRAQPETTEETPEAENPEPEDGEPQPETPPDPFAASKADLALAMAQYGSRGSAAYEDEGTSYDEELPIVRLANTIWQQAIRERASQILLEPDKRGLRVRYRVDGVLHESMTMPSYIKDPLIGRYFILTEMNLAARSLPQSGHIAISFESVPYEIRANSLPTLYGESLSMRILDSRNVLSGLNKLGMTPTVQEQVEYLVQAPNGIFLMTGPVGCGKSTTLYSLLNRLNTVERHSAAIESEAEYRLGGVTTVVADGKNGLTYAEAFRGLVRANADVILAERMPDKDAWDEALTASEEGTLVLASMTLKDAPTALRRLRNMGVDVQRIGQNITRILTQRLVRKICTNCKELYEVDASELAPLGLRLKNSPEKVKLARGRGCEECRKTGYKGQVGLFSLLRVNQEISAKIVRGDFSADFHEASRANGMIPLHEDGLEKILNGLTTIDEVFAAAGS